MHVRFKKKFNPRASPILHKHALKSSVSPQLLSLSTCPWKKATTQGHTIYCLWGKALLNRAFAKRSNPTPKSQSDTCPCKETTRALSLHSSDSHRKEAKGKGKGY